MILLPEKPVKIFNISPAGRKLFTGSIILLCSFLSASGQSEVIISPHYLFPEFVNGTVLLKSGATRTLKMNYNLITEEVLFEYTGRVLALTNLETVDTVTILSRKFIPSGKIFYEILVNNKIPLVARYTCSITPPGKPAGYGGTSQTSSVTVIDQIFSSGKAYDMKLPDDYVVTPNTDFLLIINGEADRIYNIKQVIKAFSEKESQIKEYNKANKIDFKKQEDVVNLIVFCNKKQ